METFRQAIKKSCLYENLGDEPGQGCNPLPVVVYPNFLIKNIFKQETKEQRRIYYIKGGWNHGKEATEERTRKNEGRF